MANKAKTSSREARKQKGENVKKRQKTQYQIERDAAKGRKHRKNGKVAFA